MNRCGVHEVDRKQFVPEDQRKLSPAILMAAATPAKYALVDERRREIKWSEGAAMLLVTAPCAAIGAAASTGTVGEPGLPNR